MEYTPSERKTLIMPTEEQLEQERLQELAKQELDNSIAQANIDSGPHKTLPSE